jgi:CRISPR/Cas system CSM-associated protein Csm3 (group 7 of RAMP superfamily)
MQRYFSGDCRMHLRLTPVGPWMVRGQTEQESADNRGRTPLVLMPLRDRRGRPLLPASSLKGVLRATSERILRSLDPERPLTCRPLADDPFVEDNDQERLRQSSRGQIADSELLDWMQAHGDPLPEPTAVYPLLSAASQLFGATVHAGLVTLEDACANDAALWDDTRWRRSHVAIDRFTGGVGEGPFVEALADTVPLETMLTITNFALWQLALIGLTIQELNLGYAAVGGGTRKGQGQAHIDVPEITVRYAHVGLNERGIVSAQARLAGPPWNAAKSVPAEVCASEGDAVLLPDLTPIAPRNWRDDGMRTLVVTGTEVEQLFAQAVSKVWRRWVPLMIEEARS